MWHNEAVRPSWRVRPLQIYNLIGLFKDNGSRHFEKSKNLDRGSSDFDKIWHNDVVLHS